MDIRENALKELDTFWDEYKRVTNPHVYKVDLSFKLWQLKQELLKQGREE